MNNRCLSHTDPTLWTDEPAAARPGWVRTTCAKCGGFISYRPVTTSESFRKPAPREGMPNR